MDLSSVGFAFFDSVLPRFASQICHLSPRPIRRLRRCLRRCRTNLGVRRHDLPDCMYRCVARPLATDAATGADGRPVLANAGSRAETGTTATWFGMSTHDPCFTREAYAARWGNCGKRSMTSRPSWVQSSLAQDQPKVLMTILSIGMVVVPSLLGSTLMQVCAMGSLERESMHKPRLAVEGEEEDEEDRAVLGRW